MKRLLLPLSLAALLAACGTSGNLRRISFSSDMSGSDLAHYGTRAAEDGDAHVRLERFTTGLPWWLLVWRIRESYADRARGGDYHYHFEDDWGLLIFLVRIGATARFDPEGHNVAWSQSQSLLLGAVSNANGETIVDGKRRATRSFRLLWGLFATERTARGHSWRILWIPFSTTDR